MALAAGAPPPRRRARGAPGAPRLLRAVADLADRRSCTTTSRAAATTRSSSASACWPRSTPSARRSRAAPARALTGAVDLACMNLCVLFVGLELALRLVAAFVPSPLFAQDSTDARGWLAANRLRPGALLMGFPRQLARLLRRRAGAARATAWSPPIGDSFTVGIVPHDFHFTTVAERALGCPIYAIGEYAVGPEEYALLERDEALPLASRRRARRPVRRQRPRRQPARARSLPRRHAPLARSSRHPRLRAAAAAPALPRARRRRACAAAGAGGGRGDGRAGRVARGARARDAVARRSVARAADRCRTTAYLALETRHAREYGGGGDAPLLPPLLGDPRRHARRRRAAPAGGAGHPR